MKKIWIMGLLALTFSFNVLAEITLPDMTSPSTLPSFDGHMKELDPIQVLENLHEYSAMQPATITSGLKIEDNPSSTKTPYCLDNNPAGTVECGPNSDKSAVECLPFGTKITEPVITVDLSAPIIFFKQMSDQIFVVGADTGLFAFNTMTGKATQILPSAMGVRDYAAPTIAGNLVEFLLTDNTILIRSAALTEFTALIEHTGADNLVSFFPMQDLEHATVILFAVSDAGKIYAATLSSSDSEFTEILDLSSSLSVDGNTFEIGLGLGVQIAAAGNSTFYIPDAPGTLIMVASITPVSNDGGITYTQSLNVKVQPAKPHLFFTCLRDFNLVIGKDEGAQELECAEDEHVVYSTNGSYCEPNEGEQTEAALDCGEATVITLPGGSQGCATPIDNSGAVVETPATTPSNTSATTPSSAATLNDAGTAIDVTAAPTEVQNPATWSATGGVGCAINNHADQATPVEMIAGLMLVCLSLTVRWKMRAMAKERK